MAILSADILFRSSIFTYLLSAAASIFLIKHQKACNIFSNVLCIIAAIFGASASIIQITSASGPLNISVFQSNIPFFDISIKLDALSAYFVLALSVIVVCVSIYSIGYISHYIGKRNVGVLYFLYSTFILSMLLVFTSSNAVFFYISWEAMSLLSYFLVIFESEKRENLKAGTLYLVMTHIAAAFLLIGFILIYSYTKSFDIFGSSAAIPGGVKNIIFIFFLLGFGTKAGIVPLHIWLPKAHPAAPSNVSALMSGIMIKTAVYGLIRFLLCYLGVQNTWWGILILAVGAVSALLGIVYALMERNIKRLLAFSSVENIGVIMIGLGLCFIATAQQHPFLAALALAAALLHTFNHTLFKGGLFLGAGSIQYASHTKDMEELGGLIKKMPVTALLVLCFSLSISALVPFNGFVGEWLTFQSLFANIAVGQAGLNIVSMISIAALGMTGALAAACFVKLFGIAFLGVPRNERAINAGEVPAAMNIGMGLLAVLCLLIGLFPFTALSFVDKVVAGVTGASVAAQLRGDALLPYYPIKISGSTIAPLEVLLALTAIILLTLLAVRLVGKKYVERKYGTWDCGFKTLNARMQYNATGFSKPVKIVFAFLFKPTRTIATIGEFTYHPETIEYKTTSLSVFEKKVYKPVYDAVQLISKRIKFTVQTGSVHNYLLYILLTVLLLMAYNRFV